MKIAKKLPIIRVADTILHLDNVSSIWYDEESSGSGNFNLGFSALGGDGPGTIAFSTKKAALAALDQIMLAVDIPIIEEDES